MAWTILVGILAGCSDGSPRLAPDAPLNLSAHATNAPVWSQRGDILAFQAEVPRDGAYALVLDAVAGPRKSRLDILGASDSDKKSNCHLQPGWRTSYLGRFGLSAGSTPLRVKLAWLDDKTSGAPYDSVTGLRLLPLEGNAPAAPPSPVFLMCPMLYEWQMKDAPRMIDRIATFPVSGVEFTLAIECEIDADRRPTHFGLVRPTKDPATFRRVIPLTPELREEFKSWMKPAFARAVEKKLSIALLLHLNVKSEGYVWRNDVEFNPLEPIAGFSYDEAMVRTVMEALEESVPADWPVEFTMLGEMGTTLCNHPASWRTILKQLRDRKKLSNITFGVGLNHTSNFGKADPGSVDSRELAALWDDCDYLGVSMYKDMSLEPSPGDFVSHLEYLATELDAMGAPMPPGKELHFVEIGIGGGGMSSKGEISRPAKKLEDLARVPWCTSDDPKQNPWAIPEYRDYRRKFYNAMRDFVRTQPARWPVTRTYLWTLGSCDPFGIHRTDWIDEEIIRSLSEYNQSLR